MSEMLKEIKKNHEQQIERMKKQVTMYQIHPSDVKWLIKHVERLEEENKRYREAYKNAKYKFISSAPYGAEVQRDGMLEEINKALESDNE